MNTDLDFDIPLLDLHPSTGDMRAEVLAGLRQEQKMLSPKYFYDEAGSKRVEQRRRERLDDPVDVRPLRRQS